MENIADEHFALWCQYGRAFEKYQSLKQRERRIAFVWGFIGMGGTGKTSLAKSLLTDILSEDPYIYRSKPGDWWAGYHGQRGVIMDDFNGKFDANQLLGLLDPACTRMELTVKGGFIPCAVTHVIFTTNHSPWDWYTAKDLQIGALMRRFHGWFLFQQDGSMPRLFTSSKASQQNLMRELSVYDLGGQGQPYIPDV